MQKGLPPPDEPNGEEEADACRNNRDAYPQGENLGGYPTCKEERKARDDDTGQTLGNRTAPRATMMLTHRVA
jgi:hypothetical protein